MFLCVPLGSHLVEDIGDRDRLGQPSSRPSNRLSSSRFLAKRASRRTKASRNACIDCPRLRASLANASRMSSGATRATEAGDLAAARGKVGYFFERPVLAGTSA